MAKQLPHSPKWVSDKYLADYFQVSRCTIWRWTKEGKLPAPQKLAANTSRWDFESATSAVLSSTSA